MNTFKDRVSAELGELADKAMKLAKFRTSPLFDTLPLAEQERLKRQAAAMAAYGDVLAERINADFK